MIGSVLERIRKVKGLSKTDLAKVTGINIGHLTHIEKGERNPSHKALKVLSDALEVPYEPLMHTYDKELTEEQLAYNAADHVRYDSIPLFNKIEGFVKCPKELFNASFSVRFSDKAMAPKIQSGDIVYIEFNAPLANKDYGVFEYNGSLLVRRFIIRQKDLVLRAEDDKVEDIVITKETEFNVIGKVLGTYSTSQSKYIFF